MKSIEESTEGSGVKEKPAALVTISPSVKTVSWINDAKITFPVVLFLV